MIARSGVKLRYMIYNLSTGKVEHDSHFPTDAQAFMGCHRSDISLHNTGEVSKYTWPRDCKIFFKLDYGQHEIYPAHKCFNKMPMVGILTYMRKINDWF